MKNLFLFILLSSGIAIAAPNDSAPLFSIADGSGTGLTSQVSGSKQALDVGVDVGGVQVDPRTRTWNLSSGSDSCSAVQSGTWTVQQGGAPWSVSQSGTWNINNISGTISLPTGASTSANQTTIDNDIKASQPRKLQDGAGNNITSQASSAQRALDVGIDVAGVQVDPRTRSWNLSSGSDSVAATQSGTWTVQQGTPPWSVSQSGAWTTGRTWSLSSGSDSVASVQSGSWTVTANAGTNLNTSALALESGGHLASIDTKLTSPLTVNATLQAGSAIAGKFGIDQTTPGTTNGVQLNAALPTGTNSIGQVTANAGTNLNTSALALDTSVNGVLVSQGSTTSGQKGPLAQGAVTTASPSYSTAQTSPLSLTTAGGLRTDASTVAGTATATGNGVSGSGVQRVNIASDNTAFPVKAQLQDNAGTGITSSSNGNAGNQLIHVQTPDTTTASATLGALNAVVSVSMAGLRSVGFQINSGTLIGTIQPQCSLDGGTTWASASFYNSSTNNVSSTYVFSSSNPTTVLPLVAFSGASNCRVIVSAYTSGTATAIMRASQVTGESGTIPSSVSLSNFFYDDMNAGSGGIARATNFVVSALTQLYTHSGSGTVYGFTLNLQGLGGAQVYDIDLVLDGNHIFGASGIITSDILNNALYDISQVATDNLGFAGFSFPDKAIRWSVPGGGFVSYSTSVTVNVKQTAGGAGKFNAGLIALTR